MEMKQGQKTISDNDLMKSMKKQIIEWTQTELNNVKSLNLFVDTYITRQRSKPYFSLQHFIEQSNLAFAEVQTYFTKMTVKLIQFPFLVGLTNLMRKVQIQFSKIFSFSQEAFINHFKQLEIVIKKKKPIQIPKQICLRCHGHIRHQQIKQARYNMFNLIEDPYLYYHKKNQQQIIPIQQTNQQNLQQKLNQLAIGAEFEQNCLKQLIQHLSSQSSSIMPEILIGTKTDLKNNLPVIPMIRSVFNHIKKDKKITIDLGIQTDITYKDNNKRILSQLQIKEKMNFKTLNQLCEKSLQIKSLQQKIQLDHKEFTQLKNQLDVLKQNHFELQKRYSTIQIQLNILKSKKTPIKMKHIDNLKSLTRKIETNQPFSISEPQSPHLLKPDQQLQIRFRKSKDHTKLRRTEFNPTSILNKSTNLGSFIPNNPPITRKTSNIYNTVYQQEGSTVSIQPKTNLDSDCIEQYEGLSSEFPPLSTNQQLNQFYVKPTSREEIYQIKSLDNSIIEDHLGGNLVGFKSKHVRNLTKSEHPSQMQRRKTRRIGKQYEKQQLLKSLYNQQAKEKSNQIQYQQFKNNYQKFILRVFSPQKQVFQQNQQQYRKQKSRRKLKNKTLIKTLQKKSTASIKHYLRNQIINKLQNEVQKNKENINLQIQHQNKEQQTLLNDLKKNLVKKLNKVEKKVVLDKLELNLLTQIMPELARLKLHSKNDYEVIRKLIFDSSQSSSIQQTKEALQTHLTYLISYHRSCKPLTNNYCCNHLDNLIQTITKLTS